MKYLLLLLLLPVIANAQLSDDFNDGDFTTGIFWTGNTPHFKINSNKQLQLNSSGEKTSFLSTELDGTELNEWNFLVRLTFSPSDNNLTKIWLVADNENPELISNGYYLKLGEGGALDAIELYRQQGSECMLVARGTNGFIKDSFTIKIKLTRDDGTWQIWADSTGKTDYAFQASGSDDYWQAYSHFILQCKYTTSNATKFYFDDIYAGPLIVDNVKPFLMTASVRESSMIDLKFSENMKSATAQNTFHYSLDQGIGHPVAGEIDAKDKSVIHLLFDSEFKEDISYNFSLTGLEDNAGNRMTDTTVSICYHPVRQFDVVINEIMFDPEPTLGLPDAEYLELFNTTDHDINLDGWTLSWSDDTELLTGVQIKANDFLIVCKPGNDSLLSEFGKVETLMGFSLLNTGTTITLSDDHETVIHSVTYDNSWYNEPMKEDGGWSVEQVDADNPCIGYGNWKASKDPSGGTPGRVNSVYGNNPDTDYPLIDFITIAAEFSIRVHFTEPMDPLSLTDLTDYFVDNGIGNPIVVLQEYPQFQSVILTFHRNFTSGTIYELSIIGNGSITDCKGNQLPPATKKFALPWPVNEGDLVINEILFDARSSGEEFIEIYNRSDNTIDLSNLWIGTSGEVNDSIENPCKITEQDRMILPGEYLVFTKDPELLKYNYFTPNPSSIIKTSCFPMLTNSGGKVSLLTTDRIIIDEVSYSPDMHFPLLTTTKGVSLERVDYTMPSDNPGNWQSASSAVGYATPACQNSQFMQFAASDKFVALTPKAFSPDNDGKDDQLMISCHFDEPGYFMSLCIYNSNGEEVKLLTDHFLAGAENTFIWNGFTDQGQKASSGIYIVYTEAFNTKGVVKKSKDVVVVATKN